MEVDPPYENHPAHYFQDGNIMFVLEGRIRFKLYRGIVARYSEVLANMLDISQPAARGEGQPSSTDPQEYIDGVPVVRLTDEAESFAALLDIILPPITEHSYEELEECGTIKLLDRIGSILELSRKYIVPSAEAWAKRALKRKFPIPLVEELKTSDTPESMFASSEEAAKMIHIARAQDLPHYLPPAFYFLATRPELDTILEKQLLSPADCARLFKGRVKMINAVIEIASNRPENGTKVGNCCSGYTESWWKHWSAYDLWKDLLNNPLKELKWRYDNWESVRRKGYCCSDMVRSGFEEDRKEVYRRIGDFFDL
ncbi:hypothetical protein FRC02_009535 [Tulasnella sp. 418]|nr:hypothetical protein FRC02_009535 [Tulasnella sp. 418]